MRPIEETVLGFHSSVQALEEQIVAMEVGFGNEI